MSKTQPKTLEEKRLDRLAPSEPLDYELFDAAWRVELDLKRAMADASRVLESRSSGGHIEIRGFAIPGLSRREVETIYGVIWPALLKELSYRQFHAERFVKLSKETKRQLASIRTQIDQWQNGESP